jgi:ornithine--oxo-acid transaminase
MSNVVEFESFAAPRSQGDIGALISGHADERNALHARHMNAMMVRLLRTIGYDVDFKSGKGAYLFDRQGVRYLDLLSGWGVFGIGRNHPRLREALGEVLAGDLPNLLQMGVSTLSGILAARLLAHARLRGRTNPGQDRTCRAR